MFGFTRRTAAPRAERVEPTVAQPRASSPENPTTSLSNPDSWFIDWANGGTGGAPFGPEVTERTAMTVSAVYRCVALLAGVVGSLPLKVYRNEERQGRVEVPDHRYLPFMTVAPYPGRAMSAYTWREIWATNTALWGNHYSLIRYNAAGRILGFEPAAPWSEVVRILSGPRAGQNAYRLTLLDGTTVDAAQEDVLHIPGLGFDGVKGASRVRHFARNAISLAKLYEEQSGRVHENAARPSGAIEIAPGISADGLRRMEAHFTDRAVGRINAAKPLFLDPGSKFTPYNISLEDLQTLQSRSFQNVEICRFYGVPPHLIGETATTSAWGTGIEQLTIGFMIFTLEAELQRVEAELNLKLFTGSPEYVRFDRDALRALDVKTDAEAASVEMASGALTINERRKTKHRPAVAGGDEPLVNGTMIPLAHALTRPLPDVQKPDQAKDPKK